MAEAARNLFNPPKAEEHKKDKLAAKKAGEKEFHDILKQQQRDKKEEAKALEDAKKQLLKEERMTHDTKRAHADIRHAAKKEEHRETGQMCEHGVWRCKICFPHEHK